MTSLLILAPTIYIMVFQWVVHLYVEIIRERYREDNLTYRWTNMVLLFYTTYISVDLAHHEIVHAKSGKGGMTHPLFIYKLICYFV